MTSRYNGKWRSFSPLKHHHFSFVIPKHADVFLRSAFAADEDGGSNFPLNSGTHLANHTILEPRRCSLLNGGYC